MSILFGLGASAASWYGVRVLTQRYEESKLKGNTPYERSIIRAMKAQNVFRQYFSFVRRHNDSLGVAAAMATATRRGITLLDPEDQARRIELLDHQLANTPPRDCAAMELSTANAGKATLALITSMDSINTDIFAAIVARSFQLAEQAPGYRVPRVDHGEAVNLLRAAGAGLPEPDKTRYFKAMSNLFAASDTDVCWWARTLNRYALGLEGRARVNAVRLLTLFAAQEPMQ